MFLSYIFKYNKDSGYKQYHYDTVIIDSDFKEQITTPLMLNDCSSCVLAADAIIKIYSARNLNVARNIACHLIRGLKIHYRHLIIEDRIYDFIRYIPEYKAYQKDVEKYLMLL